MRTSRFALLFAAGGLCVACSNSNGPAPSVAGTWHVTTGALGSGTLSPVSFDAVVTAAGADSFVVSMPALTWSVGPVVFDSAPKRVTFSDPTYFGFGEEPSTRTQRCQSISVSGQMSAGRDTLLSAIVTITSADTVPGGYCVATTTGSATATR